MSYHIITIVTNASRWKCRVLWGGWLVFCTVAPSIPRKEESQSCLKWNTYYRDKLYDSPFSRQQSYRWYHNNGKAFRKLWARDKSCIKFCYCKDDKESLDPPHLLIIHIPHKRKRISIKILCTCVASQLFTKHHGSDIYFLHLIPLDSQFVMLNKMCTGT